MSNKVAALQQDQADWRKGVSLIASALGDHEPKDLSCVRLANLALELRAENERLAAQVKILTTVEPEMTRVEKMLACPGLNRLPEMKPND